MGSGYIQLLAVGSEANIFNYNPNISFFKIYYRRHTNFYINNMNINGNNVRTSNIMNTLNDTIITINVPKNGDLLGKSYLNLTTNEYYFELFKFNEEMCSTLNINLMNVYDNYYIKKNNYSIKDIKEISIIKVNYYPNNSNNQTISILSSNIFDTSLLLNYINSQALVKLETDVLDIFYNMDLNLLFYSFDDNSQYYNILDNMLFNYLIQSIIYTKLEYLQIDFMETKISTKISYVADKYYKMIVDLLVSKNFIAMVNNIKIDKRYVYISLNFSLELYNLLLELFYINSEIFELEIVNNKYKSTKNTFTENIHNKIASVILNKKADTSIYLSILNSDIKSYSVITIMEKITFFGNLTNEYYNDLLIQNSNTTLDLFNLTNDKISLNLLIKIFVSLICYDNNVSTQNYLKIVNENNEIFNVVKNSSLYELSNKIISYFMDPDILIVSLKTFFVMLYSKNIYQNLQANVYTQPFTNNHKSYYTVIINNFYTWYNVIGMTNSVLNNNVDDYNYMISQLLFFNKIKFTSIISSLQNNVLIKNYISNNNLFDIDYEIVSSENQILNDNLKNLNIINDGLYINSLFSLIIQSISLLNNIISTNNIYLYSSTGNLSNVFINTKMAQNIFPLSSYIYIHANEENKICYNDDNYVANRLIYNSNKNIYIDNIYNGMYELITQYSNNYKISIIGDDIKYNINKYLMKSEFYDIVSQYYDNNNTFMEQINMKYINAFLEQIKNLNYNVIYPFYIKSNINLNDKIMYELFSYVDKNLFNNSFTNFTFKKNNKCNTSLFETNFKNELIYQNFIFNINSPLYRIYFYFTFISKVTIDESVLKQNIDINIIVLRNLTLAFLTNFLKIFNGTVLDENLNNENSKFNLTRMNNMLYFIENNFICYDKINLFNDDEFNKTVKNNLSNKYCYFYNNFYIIKKKISEYKINDMEFINNIPKFCDGLNYNYDDMIIQLFIDTIEDNKNIFTNFNDIYLLTQLFFDKNDFDYNHITSQLNIFNVKINTNQNEYSNYMTNDFMYNCYYTTFYVGITFNNINKNNIGVINNVMKLTTIYNDKYLFDYEYSFKEFNSKQNVNYIDFTNNITYPLEYFKIKLYDIFTEKFYINDNYFKNYIFTLSSYTNINSIYLITYLIAEYDFYNSVNIINKYINMFNDVNNSNISLNDDLQDNKHFTKYNFIVIIYYYIYFIFKCLLIDIIEFNRFSSEIFKINSNTNTNSNLSFQQFIIGKYTVNIYDECIDNLINLYTKNNKNIILDFSSYYIYSFDNEIYIDDFIINLNNYTYVKKNIFTNIINNNQEINITDYNLNFTPINYYTSYYINKNISIVNNKNKIFINKNFNTLYCKIIQSIIEKTNTLFYINYTNNELLVEPYNNNLSIVINFSKQIKYHYDSSIFTLGNIYTNLHKSLNSQIMNFYNDAYTKRIIKVIMYNLKNFFDVQQSNYYYSMYYMIYNNTSNSNNDTIIDNVGDLQIDNVLDMEKSIDIYTLFSKYINTLISYSIIYEQSINRIIYILSTNLLINNSYNKNETRESIKKRTLYDVVKLYIGSKDKNITKKEKIYLNNTSIYSNQSIFQIYNYQNWYNNTSFTQNYWVNHIISNIDIDYSLHNSYYNLFKQFIEYIKFFELKLFNFLLDDGISVLDYFNNIDNYDEFMNYIFNYVCSNESYSPNLIFSNIINLIETDTISSKLSIHTEHLKKKIVVFLFFTWIILKTTPELLVDFKEINTNIIIEYNLGINFSQDVKLSDVLSYENNIEIINWCIYQIFNMDLTIENKKLEIFNYPEFVQENLDIQYIVKQTKIICSPIKNFNMLVNKYVNMYNDIIGNSNIYTNNLDINKKYIPTITNLVSDINVVFNNDVKNDNPNQYDLTFYSLKLLDIRFNSLVYDLTNTTKNKLINTNQFTNKAKINYTKTVINDFNLLYYLQCLLLNNYSINYSGLQTDFNYVLNNLRNGTNNINELFEIFKGHITNYTLSLELTSEKNQSIFNYFGLKIFNIQKLNNLVSDNNNLSLVAPNDYDVLPVTINYNYAYDNFYTKYYSYNYNYNNFNNNSKVIYKKLYEYYLNIAENTEAIKNIKKYNLNLYVWLFIDLINSFISNIYYNATTHKPIDYIDVINKIIKIYFTYNYSFRLNSNITNISNLKLQKKYYDVPIFDNYLNIIEYITSYYYYQLFNTDISYTDVLNYKYDVVGFFGTLNIKQNFNFIYMRNYLNCVFKFETIIRFVYYKLSTIYSIKISIDDGGFNEIISTLISYITNYDNIDNYFNIQEMSNHKQITTMEQVYNIISNFVNKKIFYQKFSQSVNNLVYWINDKSYDENILQVWREYFSNVYFEFYVVVNNEYSIDKYEINLYVFNYLVKNYIYYVLNIDIDYSNLVQNVYIKTYILAFENILDNKNNILNPEIINEIMLLEYGTEKFLKNKNINLFIDKKNIINHNLNSSNCIGNIFKLILNDNWGIIDFNMIENVSNKKLRSCITFYNLYYSYMDWILQNEKIPNSQKQYDFNYNSNIFDELYILYWIIINVIILQYIDINIYYKLEQEVLTNAHKYINYGIKINTLNVNSNFSVYMDCLNSNIIPNNKINNYYKIIQNNTIYDSVKYKLHTFTNNINNYDSYIIQIFNNQLNKLYINDENTLGSNTFYNIIINTLNNLTSYVNIYLSNTNSIIEKIADTLQINIQSQFSILSSNLGGNNNYDICVDDLSLNKIFNKTRYKEEKSQITIFSLINNKITNSIFNNIPIILFYYICFITWTTLGINIKNDLSYIQDLFYNLANIINDKILTFVSTLKSGKPDINTNDFFEELNILLFGNYNNYEFIQVTNKFFNKLISNNYSFVSENIVNKLLGINNSLYGNTNLNFNIISQLNINTDSGLLINLENNKIINWKYLLGLVADFNESRLIYYIKSIDNTFNNLKIQQMLIDYIVELNGGLSNDYGIIKLIEKIELLFDDEIISQYFNYNYKIFIDNFQNLNKQGLLNDMLGINNIHKDNNIVSGLRPYIKFSYKRNYLIPIKFFFENYFNSIPLISCMNTNIKIITYLESSNIFKKSYYINLLTPLNITSKLNSDFILVERDERIKLCSNKIDNLIEKNNYYELIKNITQIKNLHSNKNIINVNFDIELNNSVKEIIWSFDLTVDNYELCVFKNITVNKTFISSIPNITLDELSNTEYDFIINTKFYLDGMRRDGIQFLDSNTLPDYNKITTTLNPYKYNTKVNLDKKYNTYSFALEPTEFQPSGAINMSNYKIFRIQVQIDKRKLLKYINNLNTLFELKDVNFKMYMTTYEYNIIRYQSSLGGLLFVS